MSLLSKDAEWRPLRTHMLQILNQAVEFIRHDSSPTTPVQRVSGRFVFVVQAHDVGNNAFGYDLRAFLHLKLSSWVDSRPMHGLPQRVVEGIHPSIGCAGNRGIALYLRAAFGHKDRPDHPELVSRFSVIM